jgi:hypothetical protein
MRTFFSILLFSLGILFIILGARFLFNMYRFKKTALKATATVIDIKSSTGRNWNKTYSPVLSFKTTDGVTYIYNVSAYYNTNYTIGQQIEVLYSKENPGNVKINSFRYIFMVPVVLLLLGFFGVCISAWLFYKK